MPKAVVEVKVMDMEAMKEFTKWCKGIVKENDELKRLIQLAKCPECDGSGGIPHQVGDNDWIQQQCQWCHEKNLVLKEK